MHRLLTLLMIFHCVMHVSAEPTIVTVGGGGHRMSRVDGATFANHVQWGACAHDVNDLLHVVYGNGRFVAVGGWSRPRAVVSLDGVTWEEAPEENFEGARGGSFRVLFVEGHFYLMAQMGDFLKSEDVFKWEAVGTVPLTKEPQQRVRDLAYGNGTWVGVGDFGAISVSTDGGKTWAVQQAKHHGEDRTWPQIAFGDGRFVLVGNDGYTATSVDGRSWENETTHGDPTKKSTASHEPVSISTPSDGRSRKARRIASSHPTGSTGKRSKLAGSANRPSSGNSAIASTARTTISGKGTRSSIARAMLESGRNSRMRRATRSDGWLGVSDGEAGGPPACEALGETASADG